MRAWAVLAALLVANGLAAGGETARQILDRRKHLEDTVQHWTNRHQRMRLVIVGRTGERIRELEMYERREAGDERKAIVFFHAPPEVKGTGFLSYTHKGRPADQWLYLPELKRTRQITARTRNESFVGTDLTYHDLDIVSEMASWTEEDAESSLAGEATIDGTPCHRIDLAPEREDIGYRRIALWLGKEDLVPRQLELFADEDQPKKRIRQSAVRAIGPIPVPHRVDVETPAAGTRTGIDVSEVRFNETLEDDLFSQRYLERGGR
jgi:outer membrane lipoprotein-sorting protein